MDILEEVRKGYEEHLLAMVWEAGVRARLSAGELHDLHSALYGTQAEGAPERTVSSMGALVVWLITQVNGHTVSNIIDRLTARLLMM